MKTRIYLCKEHYDAFLRSFIGRKPKMKIRENPQWGKGFTFDCEARTVLDVECMKSADYLIESRGLEGYLIEKRKCVDCGSEFEVASLRVIGRMLRSSEDLCPKCRQKSEKE